MFLGIRRATALLNLLLTSGNGIPIPRTNRTLRTQESRPVLTITTPESSRIRSCCERIPLLPVPSIRFPFPPALGYAKAAQPGEIISTDPNRTTNHFPEVPSNRSLCRRRRSSNCSSTRSVSAKRGGRSSLPWSSLTIGSSPISGSSCSTFATTNCRLIYSRHQNVPNQSRSPIGRN